MTDKNNYFAFITKRRSVWISIICVMKYFKKRNLLISKGVNLETYLQAYILFDMRLPRDSKGTCMLKVFVCLYTSELNAKFGFRLLCWTSKSMHRRWPHLA